MNYQLAGELWDTLQSLGYIPRRNRTDGILRRWFHKAWDDGLITHAESVLLATVYASSSWGML